MSYHQKFFKEKLAEIKKADVVYDIGGGAQPQDRGQFKKYVVVDTNPEYKPDIVADVQNLPFEDNSIEVILLFSVLEHVENPFDAASELYRVLKPGGKLLGSVPFIWPYHAAKLYKDYWRFSKDGLTILFKNFSAIEIVKAGGYFSMLVNFIPSFTRLDKIFKPIAVILDKLLKSKNQTPSYFFFLIK